MQWGIGYEFVSLLAVQNVTIRQGQVVHHSSLPVDVIHCLTSGAMKLEEAVLQMDSMLIDG